MPRIIYVWWLIKKAETLVESAFLFYMVPGAGVEPAHAYAREILSLLCLPISPPGRMEGVDQITVRILSLTVLF